MDATFFHLLATESLAAKIMVKLGGVTGYRYLAEFFAEQLLYD
jgi:hypothetical protein